MTLSRTFKKIVVLCLLSLTLGIGQAQAGVLFPPEGEQPGTHSCPDGMKMLLWEGGSIKCRNPLENMCPKNQKLRVVDDEIVCVCPYHSDTEESCGAGFVGNKILRTTYACDGSVSKAYVANQCYKCPYVERITDDCPGGLAGSIVYNVTTRCDGSQSRTEVSRSCQATGSYTTKTDATCIVGQKYVGTMEADGTFTPSTTGTTYTCTATGLK